MKLIASVKEHVFCPDHAISYVLSAYLGAWNVCQVAFSWVFSCNWRPQTRVFSYVPCSSSILSCPTGRYMITPLIFCVTSSPQVIHLKRSLTMDIKLVGMSQCGHTPGVISGLNFRNFLLKNLLILRLTIFFVSSQVLSSVVAL